MGVEGLAALMRFSPTATATAAAPYEPSHHHHHHHHKHHHHHHEDFNLYEHLGHLSPFFVPPSAAGSPRSGAPPGCVASRAFLAHRHGSRHPHADELAAVRELAGYVAGRSALFARPRAPVPPAWSFLRDEAHRQLGWNDSLRTDELTAPGRQQLFDHGVALRLLHPDLYDAGAGALAGDEDRVVESAGWFLDGYHGRRRTDDAPDPDSGSGSGSSLTPPPVRVIPEDDRTPSWITPWESCPAWDEKFGSDPTDRWGAVYLPPVAARINRLLGGDGDGGGGGVWPENGKNKAARKPPYPGVDFTARHARGMFWACAYGTAAGGAGASPWCGVLEPRELLDNEYAYDLRQRGFSGYGLPGDMGAVLGSLLVGNVTAFLRGEGEGEGGVGGDGGDGDEGPRLSLNFGHDKTLALGLTALGLAADGGAREGLPPEGPVDPDRAWRTSQLVPFASYMLWKRLECGGGGREGDRETRIQLVLNGANYGLGPTGCRVDKYGTCAFDDFLNTPRVKAALNVTHGDARWREVCGH